MRPTGSAALLLIAAAVTGANGGKAMALELSSPKFANGGEIPALHTCEGKDLSPALEWRHLPRETASLVLIVDDPDAPDPKAPKMTWVHWVLYDLPPSATGLAEAVPVSALPAGAREGVNDWRRTGYGGPCPPIGRHRYFFKLYALDVKLGDLSHPTKPAVEKAMQGHVLASAEWMGTYEKRRR
jgi:Raf kinase inhibitor-like YbhB/YbcL family protein